MGKLIFYTTDACHLCEQAKVIIYSVIDSLEVELVEVDIADDENLFERYGLKIPVVAAEQGATECCWPFDAAQVEALLA